MYTDAAGHLAFAVRTAQVDLVARGAAVRDLDRIRKGLDQAKKQVVTLEINVQPPGIAGARGCEARRHFAARGSHFR